MNQANEYELELVDPLEIKIDYRDYITNQYSAAIICEIIPSEMNPLF